MNESSRRGFLAVTGAGVAAVAVAPAALAAGSASTEPSHQGPVVAYVKDAAEGVVAVMVGEREVVVTDRELVARITRHASS